MPLPCIQKGETDLFHWMEVVFENVISIEEEENRCLSVSFISIHLNDFKAQNLDTYSNSIYWLKDLVSKTR